MKSAILAILLAGFAALLAAGCNVQFVMSCNAQPDDGDCDTCLRGLCCSEILACRNGGTCKSLLDCATGTGPCGAGVCQ
jgi:hypothetical protein